MTSHDSFQLCDCIINQNFFNCTYSHDLISLLILRIFLVLKNISITCWPEQVFSMKFHRKKTFKKNKYFQNFTWNRYAVPLLLMKNMHDPTIKIAS